MAEKFLDKVYGVTSQTETTAFYDDWAGTYENEVAGEGYATPDRSARMLAELLREGEAETLTVLDYGCGTGLSGLAFHRAGFQRIHGCDPSEGMLALARRKDVYDDLWLIDPDDPYRRDFRQAYDVIAAVGVISPGAAPAGTLDLLFRALPQGGRLVLSYNTHTLADPTYMGALDAVLADEHAVLDHSEVGDHLPGRDLSSRVMVIRYE